MSSAATSHNTFVSPCIQTCKQEVEAVEEGYQSDVEEGDDKG